MPVAEIIAGATLLWEMFGSEFTDDMEKSVKQRWSRFGWKKAAEDYLAQLYEDHSFIRPVGSHEPIMLDKVFTDVFIHPKPTAIKHLSVYDLQSSPDLQDAEGVNGLELVQRDGNERLFVLGGPGAGKTTFLKYLTIQAVKTKLKKIPIFIPLKRWADSEMKLMDYLEYEFQICHFPDAKSFIEHILEKGRAIVFFDGLDEIPHANKLRNKAIDTLRDFTRQYRSSPCLITCRKASVDYIFPDFKYVEMADFTPEQIRDMVAKWFAQDPEKSRNFFQDFDREENRGVREMAKTPLLLALLCLAFEENGIFPPRRVEIYSKAIHALLSKWDAERNIPRDLIYKGMTPERRHHMLSEVAIRTFIEGSYFIDQETLQDKLETYVCKLPGIENVEGISGAYILQAIQAHHGILVKRAENVYSFAHLSFHEYFSAMAIKEEASARTFDWLFNRFLTDNRWHEVFVLTASALKEASVFLATLRKAIDTYVTSDKILESVVHWAHWRVRLSRMLHSDEDIHSAYMYTLSALADGRVNIFVHSSILASSVAIARSSTRLGTRASALADALENAAALDLDNALELAQDIERISVITDSEQLYNELTQLLPDVYTLMIEILQRFATEPDYPLLRDYSLSILILATKEVVLDIRRSPDRVLTQAFTALLSALKTWSEGNCYAGLEAAIKSLTVPDAEAGDVEWGTFVADIERLLSYVSEGTGWEFSHDLSSQVKKYLQALNLLYDCLKDAYASNRDEIRVSLLIPPGKWQPNLERSNWAT